MFLTLGQLPKLLPPFHILTIISYLFRICFVFIINKTRFFVAMQTIQVGTGTKESTLED